jgi:hypothetical protein
MESRGFLPRTLLLMDVAKVSAIWCDFVMKESWWFLQWQNVFNWNWQTTYKLYDSGHKRWVEVLPNWPKSVSGSSPRLVWPLSPAAWCPSRWHWPSPIQHLELNIRVTSWPGSPRKEGREVVKKQGSEKENWYSSNLQMTHSLDDWVHAQRRHKCSKEDSALACEFVRIWFLSRALF